jgi:rhomboid protease GluP
MQWGVLERTTFASGQVWRLVSSMFLHFGIGHLLSNAIALHQLGGTIEAIYGARRYAAIYFAAGIAGGLLSLPFIDGVTAGASGAIFGLLGAAIVFGIRHASHVPQQFKMRLGMGAVPLLLFNLAFGLSMPGINNYAHVGGLICGGLLSLVLAPRLRVRV